MNLYQRLKKIPPVWFFLAGISLGTGFGLYIWNLYQQLTVSFSQEEHFNPTRIYSDVARISPPAPRGYVLERLRNLGYAPVIQGNIIQFTLHSVDYPTYLIPDQHPQTGSGEKRVTLVFETLQDSSPLQTIDLSGQSLPDLYLEPELVATLSRGGTDGKKSIRTPLKFEEVPAYVWQAIIAIEDQHFLEHKGFDPRGIARAIWINLKTLSFAQGGSTITQQLVKNLMARKTKNVFRKINELFLALLLEAKFEKEKILERYLNEVYLGQVGPLEIHGVAEGAEHFFGKKLEQLNLGEIALMAGLIRGPGYYSPYKYKQRALERQRLVLKKMVETGQIAEAEAESATKLPIRLAPPQTVTTKAPYFTDYVKADLIRQLKDKMQEADIPEAGLKVYTTLDTWMNAWAQKAIADGVRGLEERHGLSGQNRLEGALASVDPSNGYIRALIGGRNYSQSNFNRILNMKRQVGSIFKPIVYLAAIKKGEDTQGVPYSPAHPIEDSPWTLTYDRGKQQWSPKNYDKEFRGWISYRTALAYSINVAVSKLAMEIGLDHVIKTARTLGIESNLPEVPSLALGVAELSPVEMLRVYATLANRGVQDELTVIRGISLQDGTPYARFVYHPKQVYDPAPTDLLTDMLRSVFQEGTARESKRMGFKRDAAGKTGTTSNYRDAWFAGYTPQLVTVIWTGADQNSNSAQQQKEIRLTGAGSALPIWVTFMKKALDHLPEATFPHSPFLKEVKVDRHTGKSASWTCPESQTIVEKFIQGHEPQESSCESEWPKQ